jgi:hypothetical protein
VDAASQLVGALAEIFDPPEFGMLAESPELRQVVVDCHLRALQWWAEISLDASSRDGELAATQLPHSIVQRAADFVATERGVPVDWLAADVGILEVSGSWWCAAAPGYVLCSSELAQDHDAMEVVIRGAFLSGVQGSPS